MTTVRADKAMLKRLAKKRARSQKGNAVVEFALILPLFLSLLTIISSFSIAMYNKTVLLMATREGARAGTIFVAGITNDIRESTAKTVTENACRDKLFYFGDGSGSEPEVTADISVNVIQVSATYRYTILPIFFPISFRDSFTIRAQNAMRIETSAP